MTDRQCMYKTEPVGRNWIPPVALLVMRLLWSTWPLQDDKGFRHAPWTSEDGETCGLHLEKMLKEKLADTPSVSFFTTIEWDQGAGRWNVTTQPRLPSAQVPPFNQTTQSPSHPPLTRPFLDFSLNPTFTKMHKKWLLAKLTIEVSKWATESGKSIIAGFFSPENSP